MDGWMEWIEYSHNIINKYYPIPSESENARSHMIHPLPSIAWFASAQSLDFVDYQGKAGLWMARGIHAGGDSIGFFLSLSLSYFTSVSPIIIDPR